MTIRRRKYHQSYLVGPLGGFARFERIAVAQALLGVRHDANRLTGSTDAAAGCMSKMKRLPCGGRLCLVERPLL